jgi:hypothetical protein
MRAQYVCKINVSTDYMTHLNVHICTMHVNLFYNYYLVRYDIEVNEFERLLYIIYIS